MNCKGHIRSRPEDQRQAAHGPISLGPPVPCRTSPMGRSVAPVAAPIWRGVRPDGLPCVDGLAEGRVNGLDERDPNLVGGDVPQPDHVAGQNLVGVTKGSVSCRAASGCVRGEMIKRQGESDDQRALKAGST